MAKKQSIRLKPGASIGQPAAEDDAKFLGESFISHPLIDGLRDTAAPQCLLLGRTGAGKSAILWHLEQTLDNVSRIEPKEVAFEYVGNSPIIRQLTEMGVDLHTLYEYLWTHVLTLHVIRECLGAQSVERFTDVVRSLRDLILKDKKKEIAIGYLEKHAKNFWITVEQISTEVTDSIAEQLAGEAGISTAAFSAKAAGGYKWKAEDVKKLRFRAQQAICALQMRELKEAINALEKKLANGCDYYVLIDNLDVAWVGDDQTQYALIRALIESLKTFRRIPNLKIIVALREDLYEATIRTTTDKHFQAEKLEGIISRIRWNDGMLGALVERRVQQLFRYQYKKQSVALTDVLSSTVAQAPLREFLLTRTLKRPRDVIAFVNRILVENEGEQLPVTARGIARAEPSYSDGRRKALEDEWRSCHPLIASYLQTLQGLSGVESIETLDEERLFTLAYEVTTLGRAPVDDVERLAMSVYETGKEQRFKRLARALAACLYKVGAIGLKLGPAHPYNFCYQQRTSIGESEISDNPKFIVHPMLSAALGYRVEKNAA